MLAWSALVALTLLVDTGNVLVLRARLAIYGRLMCGSRHHMAVKTITNPTAPRALR